jgi:hypothetical protein
VGQLWIEERNARQHQRAAQAHLDRVLLRREHGVARDLGAGARGGRDGHEGERRQGERATGADHLEVVDRISTIREQRRDGLSGIQGASTTDGHHRLAVPGESQRHSLPRDLGAGLTAHLEEPRGDLSRGQAFERGGGPLGRRAGHHQSPPAERRDDVSQLADATRSEQDLRRGGELEAHTHPPAMVSQRASSGKQLWYLVLFLGSAIIGATASRQI